MSQLSALYSFAPPKISQNDPPKKIVVIGSGIGGMASGAVFAKSGHTVTVLESNDQYIGGHGRCLRINGMRYSMGPQYVWDFGEGESGDRFLRFLEIKGENPFIRMNPLCFERLFIGDKKTGENYFFLDFKVPMGLEAFGRELKNLFPEEGDQLDCLFTDMISMYGAYKEFFKKNSLNESRVLHATKFLLTGKISSAMKVKLGKTIYMTLNNFFDRYTISPLARRILYGHGGIFAENESDMSAMAYIVGTGNYHDGAWYPEKGFHHFFDSLAGVIRENGGAVETGRQVVRLEMDNGLVSGALCGNGEFYECDFVFSDISPRLTYALLEQSSESFDYTPSHAVGACCMEVRGGLPQLLEMTGRNYWWQDGREVDYNFPDITRPPRMLFINSPTVNGFGREERTENDALVMFFPTNYFQEKKIYEKGPDAVERMKKQLVSDIVDILERNVFPGISSQLVFAEIISSVDTEEQTHGERGNAYGRRLTVDEILKGSIKEKNRPDNLYNVSATKNTPGIAAGIFTAELLFTELTGQSYANI
jgi:all-trans-retinol 13,14-reductase